MSAVTEAASRAGSRSRSIRSSLDHPVVDADGHWIESIPIFLDFLRDAGGAKAIEQFRGLRERRSEAWYRMTADQRLANRQVRPGWWGLPADSRDRATAMIPTLMHERLDEFGIDVALIYPTLGLLATTIPDADFRLAFVRALNTMAQEMFDGLGDRLIPAAIIPTYTPAEAIEELRFVTDSLGMRLAFVNGSLRRPVPVIASSSPSAFELAQYVDSLALDSNDDYDPLWQEFASRGLAVTTHAGSMGWADRRSPTNFTFNHIGHFAQSNHVFAKALFLSGVTHRFPELNFAFLEGGAGWAVNLYMDLVSHWEKRSIEPMIEQLRPTNLSVDVLRTYFEDYSQGLLAGRTEEILASFDTLVPELNFEELSAREADIDDFAAAGVASKADIAARFGEHFYFGCEADDPTTAWAFDSRLKAPIKPLFSSDIGHFDVLDMSEVVEEAYEMVEDGHLNAVEFRQFTFDNVVELHGGMNPQFFAGTRVEDVAKATLATDDHLS